MSLSDSVCLTGSGSDGEADSKWKAGKARLEPASTRSTASLLPPLIFIVPAPSSCFFQVAEDLREIIPRDHKAHLEASLELAVLLSRSPQVPSLLSRRLQLLEPAVHDRQDHQDHFSVQFHLRMSKSTS